MSISGQVASYAILIHFNMFTYNFTTKKSMPLPNHFASLQGWTRSNLKPWKKHRSWLMTSKNDTVIESFIRIDRRTREQDILRFYLCSKLSMATRIIQFDNSREVCVERAIIVLDEVLHEKIDSSPSSHKHKHSNIIKHPYQQQLACLGRALHYQESMDVARMCNECKCMDVMHWYWYPINVLYLRTCIQDLTSHDSWYQLIIYIYIHTSPPFKGGWGVKHWNISNLGGYPPHLEICQLEISDLYTVE